MSANKKRRLSYAAINIFLNSDSEYEDDVEEESDSSLSANDEEIDVHATPASSNAGINKSF